MASMKRTTSDAGPESPPESELPTECATTYCDNTPVFALVPGCRHPICVKCAYNYEKKRCAMCNKDWEVRRCIFGERKETTVVVDTYCGHIVACGATAEVFINGVLSHREVQRDHAFVAPSDKFVQVLEEYGIAIPGSLENTVERIHSVIVEDHYSTTKHTPKVFVSGDMVCVACPHCDKAGRILPVYATLVGEAGYFSLRISLDCVDSLNWIDDPSLKTSMEIRDGVYGSDLKREKMHALLDFAWKTHDELRIAK